MTERKDIAAVRVFSPAELQLIQRTTAFGSTVRVRGHRPTAPSKAASPPPNRPTRSSTACCWRCLCWQRPSRSCPDRCFHRRGASHRNSKGCSEAGCFGRRIRGHLRQVQQACGNSGKRPPTMAEWQLAMAGTPDPGSDNGHDGLQHEYCERPSTPARAVAARRIGGACDVVGNVRE